MALFRRRSESDRPVSSMSGPEALDVLLHAEGQRRLDAMKVLGERGDISAVAPLVELTTELAPAARVAVKALEALDRRGYRVAPELLVDALPRVPWAENNETTNERVADQAVALLRSRADSRQVPALAGWLGDPFLEEQFCALPPGEGRDLLSRSAYGWLQRIALAALPHVNDPAAVAALAACDRGTCGRLAFLEPDSLLGALNDAVHPSRVDAMIEFLRDPPRDTESSAAAQALVAKHLIATQDPRVFDALLAWVDAGGNATMLPRFGDEAFEALLARVERLDGTVRPDVVHWLGNSRDPRAAERLRQALDAHNGTGPGSTELVRALGQLGDRQAVDGLVRVLDRSDAAEPDAGVVVQALGEIGDPRAVDAIARSLDRPGPAAPDVATVVRTLAGICDPRAVEQLRRILEARDWPESLKAALLRRLESYAGGSGEPLLQIVAAQDWPELYRILLVDMLGWRRNQAAVDGLVRVLEAEQWPGQVAHVIVNALGRIGSPRAADALFRILGEHEWTGTHLGVAVALAQVGDARAIPALLTGLDPVDLSDVRSVKPYVDALIQLGDCSVLPALRRVDPGPSPDPRMTGARDNDREFDRLEARKDVHDAIAAFAKSCRELPTGDG